MPAGHGAPAHAPPAKAPTKVKAKGNTVPSQMNFAEQAHNSHPITQILRANGIRI